MSQKQQDNENYAERLQDIVSRIEKAHQNSGLSQCVAQLVAASKMQNAEKIEKFILAGQKCFGENRIQEAAEKWPALKARYPELRLHFIGHLQSNKVAEAVALFDVIETLDREKIALALDKEMKKQGRRVECMLQVNIGEEAQKSGIVPSELADFLAFCARETELAITGLMCVPPAEQPPAPYFALMHELARRHHLPKLSMGMSSDFETAIAFGATHVRVGTALFGNR